MIQRHLVDEAREIAASPRWRHPDTPGFARIVELGERLASPETYRAFRQTPDGAWLLEVVEAYEDALNDDWLPYAVFGLPLEAAREFAADLARELERRPLSDAVTHLRARHAELGTP